MTLRRRVLTLLPMLLSLLPATVTAQSAVPLPPFRSVEFRGGACKVILRQGPVQRVTVHQGNLNLLEVMVQGERLVVDTHNHHRSRGDRLELEIVIPHLEEVSLRDGGVIRTEGSFPPAQEIRTSVRDGGTIDIRSIRAARVDASVFSGGRILLTADQSLVANVAEGGNITWWGRAQVRESVRDGGVIERGSAADFGKPLASFGPAIAPLPPLPGVPPVPRIR